MAMLFNHQYIHIPTAGVETVAPRYVIVYHTDFLLTAPKSTKHYFLPTLKVKALFQPYFNTTI